MKILSIVMALLLFIMPFLTLANQNNVEDAKQAIIDATRDAKDPVNSHIWFPAGCLFGVFGIAFAYVYTPPLPITRLLGKSPEYVAHYTQIYQNLARNDQVFEATAGCAFSTLILTAWIVFQNPDFRY